MAHCEAAVSIRRVRGAVGQGSIVLGGLEQSGRNPKPAARRMRKLLTGQSHTSRVMITDKLRSYDVAKREIMAYIEHHSDKGFNNRGEFP